MYKINESENDFMENLYDHGLLVYGHYLSFFQNHLICQYINILILCELTIVKPKLCK